MKLYAYHLAPLADALYDRFGNDDRCHRGWRFSLYRALRSSILSDDTELYWKTAYHQWSTDHHYRGSKHGASSRISNCRIASIERISPDAYQLHAVFTDMEGRSASAECRIGRGDFSAGLWQAQNPDGDTLLNGPLERDLIFDSLAGFEPLAVAEDPTLPTNEPIDLHPKLNALHGMVNAIRELYARSSAEEQVYLETVIGAAVFYLPQSVDHFAGYMSIEALRNTIEDERRVKDHIFPRKRAGRHLLTTPLTQAQLHEKYHNELARFMYLTPSENARMVNYHDAYEDHDTAMEALGIVKFPFAGQPPFTGNKEIKSFAALLVQENISPDDQDALRSALDSLRTQQV
jgi:hypothetical protein